MKKITTRIQSFLGDRFTPVGLYHSLRDHFPNALLLESSDYHDRSDSKSYICLEPLSGFEATGTQVIVEEADQRKETIYESNQEVLNAFVQFYQQFEIDESCDKSHTAGLWGYSAFESVQYMEDIDFSNQKRTELKANPDMKYQLFRFVLEIDHFLNRIHLIEFQVDGLPASAVDMEQILLWIEGHGHMPFGFRTTGEERSNMCDTSYKEKVERGVAHCQRGNVFQVVLSRSFEQDFEGDDFNLYRCLRSVNPSPYLFYFDYGSFRIFGSSPESQLQIKDRIASIHPIAGTIRRGTNQAEDLQLAEELKAHPKEQAEHVMLLDLARNDLSKFSSGVHVAVQAEVQFFSHLIHLVSRVDGQLNAPANCIDVYAGSFPAGTLSGAPKYKAMEIIAEEEPDSRNFYGGALGFIGFNGDLNHAIIIRSVLSKHNTLTYQAGAGIVAKSTPDGELQEVYNKIAAIRSAIQMANAL